MKYEVGVCLKTSWIVWINDPFKGAENDATIFKNGLPTELHEEEAVEADRCYKGDDKLKLPGIDITSEEKKMKSNRRAQHEAINGRLKQFNVLTTHFRRMKPKREGMIHKYGMFFNAMAVITQLKFIGGASIWEDGLEYNFHYF